MRFSRGSSFIEVMTVVAFIGIMMGVVFVSLSERRDEEALKAAAREVAAVIRVAQNNALSGVKKEGENYGLCRHIAKGKDVNTYETYVRHLKNSSSTDCNASSDINDFLLNTYTLSNGVSFNDPTWSVSFSVPRGNLVEASDQSIVLKKGSKYSAVCVLTSGVIVEKPVSTTVPSCS